MRFKDRYGMKYRAIKKNNNYYLISEHYDTCVKSKYVRIEVKGKDNVFTFIRNNRLVRI